MRPDTVGNLLTEWSRLVAGVLRASGITDVFVSPGSRSTPYLLALLETDGIECHSVIDERAAAFAALGFARKAGRPAAVLCTSGTAPAHHFPAVIEAFAAKLPLVVLSADRARREQDRGAAQTIDQTRLFGNFATFLELGDPVATPGAFRSAARKLNEAIDEATFDARPLHVNLPADKPLEPREASTETERELVLTRRDVLASLPRFSRGTSSFDPTDLGRILESTNHPAIIAGPLSRADAPEVEALAKHLGAPLFGEAASNLTNPIPAEFGLLSLREAPDLFLHFGGPLTSSSVQRFLETSSVPRLQVSRLADPDPAGTATILVPETPSLVARALCVRVPSRVPWNDNSGAKVRTVLDAELARESALSEPKSVFETFAAIPDDVPLVLGNSLSIRLVDWIFGASISRKKPEVLVQRGVNGIDGFVAGAQGTRLASKRGAALLLGDVSVSHDLTSLGLFGDEKKPLAVIVLDNSGGRLFDHLPARAAVEDEKKWAFFRTVPGLDFEFAARAFGVGYVAPALDQIGTAVGRAFETEGTTLVHLRTDSKTTADFLARCRAALNP